MYAGHDTTAIKIQLSNDINIIRQFIEIRGLKINLNRENDLRIRKEFA